MKNITVLGSTGSIGRQTLEVAAANPDKLKIRVLAAHNNVPLMIEQIEKVQPDFAVLSDAKAARALKEAYRGKTEILSGKEGLLAAAPTKSRIRCWGLWSGTPVCALYWRRSAAAKTLPWPIRKHW